MIFIVLFFVQGSPTIIPTVAEKPKRQLVAAIQGMFNSYDTNPDIVLKLSCLRTVPTKYKGFCARLGPCGKSRSLQGLLESTRKNRGSHAFFRDN